MNIPKEELWKALKKTKGNFIELRTFDRFQVNKIIEVAKKLYDTETEPDRRFMLDEIIERAKGIGFLVEERLEKKEYI